MKQPGLIVLIILMIQACSDRPGDPFYTHKGEFDMSRFPMIKPYEAITMIPQGEEGWSICVTENDTTAAPFAGSIPGVKGLNVIDSTIFAYGKNTIIQGQAVKEGWFVLVPRSGTFHEFKTRNKYLQYLSSIGVKPPKLFDPNDVLQHYFAKDTLDWEAYNRDH
jgi:hypothetical protein